MAREYRNFTREEKIKAVKMVLIDKKSQMEVERTILGKKKCTGTINRWIREYIREGEDNCFKKKKGLKKVEITEKNVRYEILKKFNAFLEKEIRTNSNSLKNSKNNTAKINSPLVLKPYLLTGLEMKLKNPGDTVSYSFDVYNKGTLDAQIAEVKKYNSIICTDENGSTTSLDAVNVCKNIIYTIKYTEKTSIEQTEVEIPKGTDVDINQILKSDQHVNMTLTITNNPVESYIPSSNVTIIGLNSYIVYKHK